jgi:hypothetical protein
MSKDKLGIIMSVGCLLHCIMLPVIIPVLPALGFAVEHEAYIHVTLSLIVSSVLLYSIKSGYKKHKDLSLVYLAIVSSVSLVGSGLHELAFGESSVVIISTICSSLIVIYVHYKNHIKICKCEHH